ncbi:MAG: CapA family protein [Firmicutes bacterium]|nr:CapA family protein [Bacillota bacterium]
MKNKYILPMIFFFLIVMFLGVYISDNYNEDVKKYGFNIKDYQNKLIKKGKYKDIFTNLNDSKNNPSKINISISAVGDIMFHTPQIKAAFKEGVFDFTNNFSKVKKYIESSDLALANFESVTAGNEHRFRGYPTFNSPKQTLDAIKDAGFDILSTANNHSIDMGKEGIIDTIDYINKLNLKNVGTYKTPNKKVLTEDVNGVKISFLSYTYGCNGLESRLTDKELSYMVNMIDKEKIKSDLVKVENSDTDLTVVFIHWGHEYHRNPSLYQKNLAKNMVKWGADIILGSHPHVIQESEFISYKGEEKFVIYSLGNFISNQRRETLSFKNRNYTEDGVIVKINITKDYIKDKVSIKEVNYIPTWVNRDSKDGKLSYEVLPVKDYLNDESLNKGIITKLKNSFNNTMEQMYAKEN